jgi:diguanylate cyclase (GGDEF)-like protein
MRTRLWASLAVVFLTAAFAVVAAVVIHERDTSNFQREQREEAARAARQAETTARISIGQLGSAAAFFQAEGRLSQHDFGIVAHSLLRQEALDAAAFVDLVPRSQRSRYERATGTAIVERAPGGALRRAGVRPEYFPLTYVVAERGAGQAQGFDLGSEPERAALLNQALEDGKTTAGPIQPLPLGGVGLAVYRPIYRDGAAIASAAQRRAALIGFVAGTFRVDDLAAAAVSAVPNAVDVQLQVDRHRIAGSTGELEDTAHAPFQIANRTWLLVVSDPNRPGIGLPLLLGIVGLALAALLGTLIFTWSRGERVRMLEREASEDPLTGLRNRRRFDEDLELAVARARREQTTGALVMLDLDHFKLVNDTYGHPAGDHLIREVAEALRKRTRASDVLARLGGDEFAVILPRCSPGEARLAAEAMAAAIREHDPRSDGVAPVTVSIGVAMFGDRPRTSNASIVSEADSAMYAAKDGGRDAIRFFDRQAILDDAPEEV